ncbi:MAG: hypothetical protein QM760_16130 [Nibricoccus sp.]
MQPTQQGAASIRLTAPIGGDLRRGPADELHFIPEVTEMIDEGVHTVARVELLLAQARFQRSMAIN